MRMGHRSIQILLRTEESAVDVWASALHAILQEKLFGTVNREELLDNYGIVDSMTASMEAGYTLCCKRL